MKNLLDSFVRFFSHTDEIKVYRAEAALSSHAMDHDPSQPPPPPDAAQLTRPYDTKPGGRSFCHDMGAHNNFAPEGRSSYELANLTSTFSWMTMEQLCNWTLTAACYMAKTRDKEWLKKSKKVVRDCLASVVNRGGEVGFAQYDSNKTAGGQEITTYDSLDHSLAQTRNNVHYMAVKSWATYRALALLFRDLGDKAARESCLKLAEKVAGLVTEQAVDGVLPAIFEKENPGYNSRILPAVEGCAHPLYFNPGVVEVFRKADAAHVKWQVEGSSYWACSDRIVSGEGKASRYYPRIITSALWMD